MSEDGTGFSGKLNIGDIQIRGVGRNACIGGTGRNSLGVHHLVSTERRNGGSNASGVARNSVDQFTPAEGAIDIQVNETLDRGLIFVVHRDYIDTLDAEGQVPGFMGLGSVT